DPAEAHELADGVDVAGHAGDQGAALLGSLGEQGQVVDVAERALAQGGQCRLGHAEQATVHQDVGDRGGQQHQGGQTGGGGDVADVGDLRGDDPFIGDGLF